MLGIHQCSATDVATGQRCTGDALFGLPVCGRHGGAAKRPWQRHLKALSKVDEAMARYPVRGYRDVLAWNRHRADAMAQDDAERYEDDPTPENRWNAMQSIRMSQQFAMDEYKRDLESRAPTDDDIERILAAAEAELRRRGVEVEAREPLIIEAAPTVEGEWTQ